MQMDFGDVIFKFESLLKDVCYDLYFRFLKNVTSSKREEAQCLVVSFPKSGRTWLRALLAKYFELTYDTPFDVEFENLPQKLPSFQFTHIVQSLKHARNKKIVILLRDPRDVLVSYYHARSRRATRRRFRGTASNFIRSRWGIRRIVNFLNKIIRFEPLNAQTLYLSYEALQKSLITEMTKLLKFLELPVNQSNLLEAIQFCTFEKMHWMEKRGAFDTWRLKPSDKNNVDSFKVRKGKVGGYIDELEDNDILFIENYILKHLDKRMRKRLAYTPALRVDGLY